MTWSPQKFREIRLERGRSANQVGRERAIPRPLGDYRRAASVGTGGQQRHGPARALGVRSVGACGPARETLWRAGPDPAMLRAPDGGPVVAGHRGALFDRPESTMAGYELALDQGASGIECDVRKTADRHLVVIHDSKVDRTADGTGEVAAMTLEQLEALDYGTKHPSAKLGAAQGNTGIPLFKDLLKYVEDYPRPVKLLTEDTDRDAIDALLEVLRGPGSRMVAPTSAEDCRLMVISRWPDLLWQVRTAFQGLPTVLIWGSGGESFATAKIIGATAITMNIKELRSRPDVVEKAREAGLGVICAVRDSNYGATRRLDVDYCMSLGVDVITTNDPVTVERWVRPGMTSHG